MVVHSVQTTHLPCPRHRLSWIPTIRGRNTGIWSRDRLVRSGMITLEDPLVSSVLPLPDTSYADVTLECNAVNHSDKPFTGILHGKFGAIDFLQRVSIPASEQAVATSSHPTLTSNFTSRDASPALVAGWLWRATSTMLSSCSRPRRNSGSRGLRGLIRQITSDGNDGNLHLFVNGRRLIAKGGSWGFGESMLRFRAREYDVAVRYHREMNFNMIRNWVGQVGDDAFFEACDRHGILVWQDFWLANPWDGPVPEDDRMFAAAHAAQSLRAVRHHPSIGIYCGRNEWFPPKALDAGFRYNS